MLSYTLRMAHTPEAILAEELKKAAELVTVGARYAHYRHPDQAYRILAIGLLEASEEPAIVYQAEYGEQLTFIRPLASWLESVDDEGALKPRFSRIV